MRPTVRRRSVIARPRAAGGWLLGLALSVAPDVGAWPFSPGWTAGAPAAPNWGYVGELGPSHWAQLAPEYQACGQGTRQSPIDLRPRIAAPEARLSFHYRSSPLSLVNDGRAIWGDNLAGSYLLIDDRRYELVRYQFRTPSEHRIEGLAADLEIQLIHRDPAGRLLIVAVLAEAGRRTNSILYRLAEHLPPSGEAYYGRQLGINPLFLLPTRRGYLSYPGSLTTPPCTEEVEWILMSERVEVDPMTLRRFHQAMGTNGRPLQPANGRPVFFHRRS